MISNQEDDQRTKSRNKDNEDSAMSSSVDPGAVERQMIQDDKHAGSLAFRVNEDGPPSEDKEQAEEQLKPPAKSTTNTVSFTNPANPPVPGDMEKPSDMSLPDSSDTRTSFQEGDQSASDKKEEETPATALASAPQSSAAALSFDTTESQLQGDPFGASRTGWAPRFHIPDEEIEAEGPGETLLDHQTWLEAKLNDKFFGDWYHNTGIIIFACFSSWAITVIGLGFTSVLVIMLICATYYRTSIRRTRRNFRDDLNRQLAKQRLETDTESLEWINEFLTKFWPIYAPILCDTIITNVDRVLETATPSVFESIHLRTFILGSKPPRLEHVKTYPRTDPDAVVMDWKFSFTPMDILDLTARELRGKINPKVVLHLTLGRIKKSHDLILEDFQFAGSLRVKLKLQTDWPHIERIDMSFLGRPEIDYVCKPIGGDFMGLDVNFIPGVKGFIQEQIHTSLENSMYDPNVLSLEVARMLSHSSDHAIGVVAVTLHGGNKLRNPDKFSSTPDPYVALSLNRRKPIAQTRTIRDDDSPKWNETLFAIITSFTDTLTLQVFDWSEFRKNKELGCATFALDQLEESHEHCNLALDVLASGRNRGNLNADVYFFPVMAGSTTEGGEDIPAPELNTGIAHFTVVQARDLDTCDATNGAVNPVAVLLLNGKVEKTSKKLKRNYNPIFPRASKELLITDRKSARLGVLIKNDHFGEHIIARFNIKLNDLLLAIERGQEWFDLEGSSSARIKITCNWKPVALRAGLGGGGYMTPIGVMRVHIQKASQLRNLEAMSKSDPYCQLLLSGIPVGRTVTFQNNLDPEWDEVHYVPVHSKNETLILEVMDEELLGQDRALGATELSVADWIHESKDGTYAVDDEKQVLTSGLRISKASSEKGLLTYTVAFYPSSLVNDPEEDEKEADVEKALAAAGLNGDSKRPSSSRTDETRVSSSGSVVQKMRRASFSSHRRSSAASIESHRVPDPSKLTLSPDNLSQYSCGFIVLKVHEVDLGVNNVYLTLKIDDYAFPSYVSPLFRNPRGVINDVGDAFVRELSSSSLTLSLINKAPGKSEDDHERAIATFHSLTLDFLLRSLYQKVELPIRGADGVTHKLVLGTKFVPVEMTLDPEESIDNEGMLRVGVLSAKGLPSADRNGFSDPFCKLSVNEKIVFKSKVQKKTLDPVWDESFETSIKNRIRSTFKVEVFDWDISGGDDFLGSALVDLKSLEPMEGKQVDLPLEGKSGTIQLRLLFRSSYITRERQGTSSLSNAFTNNASRIVAAPTKGAGLVGGTVVRGANRGATFFKSIKGRAFRGGKGPVPDPSEITEVDVSDAAEGSLPPMSSVAEANKTSTEPTNLDANMAPVPESLVAGSSNVDLENTKFTGAATSGSGARSIKRSRSVSITSSSQQPNHAGEPSTDTGNATISIISATGYPAATNLRISIRQFVKNKSKEVFKTRHLKAQETASDEAPVVRFDQAHETFRIRNITADQQFMLQAKDHSTFSSDEFLGEAVFFVDDQGSSAGRPRTLQVGKGKVTIITSFDMSGFVSDLPSIASSSVVGGLPDQGQTHAGLSAEGGTGSVRQSAPGRKLFRRLSTSAPKK